MTLQVQDAFAGNVAQQVQLNIIERGGLVDKAFYIIKIRFQVKPYLVVPGGFINGQIVFDRINSDGAYRISNMTCSSNGISFTF